MNSEKMKTNVHFDPEPFAETRCYAGIFTIVGENKFQPDQEFRFTLITQHDENTFSMVIIDITWTDQTPPDSKEAENKIREYWGIQINKSINIKKG